MQNNRRPSLTANVSLCMLLLAFACVPAFAAEHFSQKLSWKADKNALEYRVEIQPVGGKSQFVTTEDASVSISLPAGTYRYRVYAYDVLGRESSVSAWATFEILQANAPKIQPPASVAALDADGSTLELSVPITDIVAASTVELVNAQTGKTLRGTLVLSATAGSGGSEVAEATSAQFKNVPEGNWKLRVTNPSGLTSETAPFEVKDVIKAEQLAKAAAEEQAARERAAAEKAAREEEKRIAAEKAAAEKAAREEEARLAAEKAAAEKAAREEEARRIAEERAAAEKAAADQAAFDAEVRRRAKELVAEEKARVEANKRLAPMNDIQIASGVGTLLNVTGGALSEFSEDDISLLPMLRIAYTPGRIGAQRLGMEFGVKVSQFSEATPYYTTELTLGLLQANFVYQQSIIEGWLYAGLRLGGGIAMLGKNISYAAQYTAREKPAVELFFYPEVQGGLSLMFIPFRHIALEGGIDFDHLLSEEMPSLLMSPYVCVVLRL